MEENQDRMSQVVREIRILGIAIRGNWGTLDGRTVQDVCNEIAEFAEGGGTDELDSGRNFYHYNNSVDCMDGVCDHVEWVCPVCHNGKEG